MIELIIGFFTSGGAVGLGALLNNVFGMIGKAQDRKAEKEKLEGLRNIQNAEVANKFLESQFGNNDAGNFGRNTRRVLALIGVGSLAIYGFHCFALYDAEFYTLPSIAAGEGYEPKLSVLFGLVELPWGNNPISLTLGHVGVMIATGFQIILGFYFSRGND